MSDDLTFSAAEVEALAAKLDQLDLFSSRERTLLTGVFLLAGQAAADDADVAGFMPTAVENMSLNFSRSGLPGYLGGNGLLLPAVQKQFGDGGGAGVPGAFTYGMHGSGGGGGAG